MKKIAVLCLCAALVGCASTGPAKKSFTVSPTGIVSIIADKDIGWYGEEKKKSSGLLGDLIVAKVESRTGEDPAALLPVFEDTLRKTLAAHNVQVADSASVIGSAAYLSAKEDTLLKASGMLTPAGYRFVSERNAALSQSLAKGANLASGMYINVKFDKNMHTGVQKNGTAVACITMNVIMVNADGKIVAQKSFYGSSSATFTIIAGMYKTEDLMARYPEAIADACEKFAKIL